MPFQIVRNDITKMSVDAIVNPASGLPGYGAGIDKAVYEAAGAEALYKRRAAIGRIECGAAAVTEGFALPARYIIHTVGCPWRDGLSGEEDIIRNCYRSSLAEATKLQVETVAVPLLASGSFGFPKGIAMDIALSEIKNFLKDNELTIFLVVFDDETYSFSSERFGDIDSYIDSNYVAEVEDAEYGYADEDFEEPRESRRERRKFGLFKSDRKMMAAAPMREESPNTFAGVAPEATFMQAMSMAAPQAPAKPAKKLEDVVKNLDKSFMELVFTYADEKGITDVELQKKANINRKAFSKLKCGTTKNPSKPTALCFAIALELSLDETRDLLARAGLALSPCSKQDVIVQYFIERGAYDIYVVNEALFAHGESPIGDVEA